MKPQGKQTKSGQDPEAQLHGRRIRRIIAACLCFILAATIYAMVTWYVDNYDTSLAGLLFTVSIPQKGTGPSAVIEPAKRIAVIAVRYVLIYLALVALTCGEGLWRKAKGLLRGHKDLPSRSWEKAARIRAVLGGTVLLAGFLSMIVSPAYALLTLDVPEYIQRASSQTSLYEEEYVAPRETGLKAPADKPNLISLYLESMETTYASEADGGVQPVNYMPQLTKLAAENISFSNTDKLGGFHSTENTNWTMAALFAGTSGLPFAFPVEQNSMWKYTTFAPSIETLGDLLNREGYTQEFLCGSDGEYGGRALYFRSHGDYSVYDLWKAREAGDIPEDYYVWWGFEDHVLFEIAKKEATRLWEAGEPFNLTILTVDAHHLGGFVCDACGDEYEEPTANVIACTDRQVAAFVAWCKEQPFWDSTVMVINGDHPRMDNYLTEGVSFLDRTIYNCFLNARKTPQSGTDFRESTMMDLYPTTLSAMGWEIPGDRLGLGTDLFSATATLAERRGIAWLNEEVMRYSQYFVDHFAK